MGPENGLEQTIVTPMDTVVTIPVALLGWTVGYLTSAQDALLARAIIPACDLDIALHDS